MQYRGFTLLELLVALVTLSVVTTLAYASLNTSIRTIEQRESHAQALHRGHFILRHITEHLQSIHADREAFYRMVPESELVVFSGEGDALEFWTRSQAHARRAQPGGLIHLRYHTEVEESEEISGEAGEALTLVVEAHGDLADDADPVARWTLPVSSVAFEYFDGESWSGSWDVETQEALPNGVRVELALPRGDEEHDEPLTLLSTIPIHFSASIAFEPEEESQGLGDEDSVNPEDPDDGA